MKRSIKTNTWQLSTAEKRYKIIRRKLNKAVNLTKFKKSIDNQAHCGYNIKADLIRNAPIAQLDRATAF